MKHENIHGTLIKLVKTDIISKGSTIFRYKGLGDEIFKIVFRKLYEKEIERGM